MKLIYNGKVVREIPVFGMVCGTRVDAIQFDTFDMHKLLQAKPEIRDEFLTHLALKFGPPKR